MNNLPLEGNEEILKELYAEMARQLKAINDPWYKEKILDDLLKY